MIRRLLHAILDHESARLRERNRDLEEEIVECRKNTNTVIREQNTYIRTVQDERDRARHERMDWQEAAMRIARELGADLETKVDDIDPSWPGFVITRALEKIREREISTYSPPDIKTGMYLDHVWTLDDLIEIDAVLATREHMRPERHHARMIIAKLITRARFAQMFCDMMNEISRQLRLHMVHVEGRKPIGQEPPS